MVHAESETAVLECAASSREFPTLSDLTAETLRQITASKGVDFATALLYDRVRRLERNASFITQIDGWKRLGGRHTTGSVTNEITIAIVPAAFYKEKPHSGADGRVVRQAADRMDLCCELIPLRSTGTLAENSTVLLDWLRERPAGKIVLVSLCKGAADVKFALSIPGAHTFFANVNAWVSVCGTPGGSPVARWLLETKARSMATWLLLKCGGHGLDFLREIIPDSSGPLSGPLEFPPAMQLIHVAGFPLQRHLSNAFMRRCHKILSPQGPNDGGVLLEGMCRLPGLVYPVWGADHYLRPDDRAVEIMTAILTHVISQPARQGAVHSQEEPCRAN